MVVESICKEIRSQTRSEQDLFSIDVNHQCILGEYEKIFDIGI